MWLRLTIGMLCAGFMIDHRGTREESNLERRSPGRDPAHADISGLAGSLSDGVTEKMSAFIQTGPGGHRNKSRYGYLKDPLRRALDLAWGEMYKCEPVVSRYSATSSVSNSGVVVTSANIVLARVIGIGAWVVGRPSNWPRKV